MAHSGPKQRITSQASEIKFIKSFKPRKQIPAEKNAHPIPYYQIYNGPSLTGTGISDVTKTWNGKLGIRNEE